MFNNQLLKCLRNCKSVSSTHTFVKDEVYTFAVIRHNDEDYDIVLKFPNIDGELVDCRMFEDADTSFMDEPYFEVKDTRTLVKTDAKGRAQVFSSILCGGSKTECNEFLHKLFSESLGVGTYAPGISLIYTDARAAHSIEIQEIG